MRESTPHSVGELGFEPSASTSSANGALILDGSERNKENFEKQPRTIGTVSLDLTESVSEKGAKQYRLRASGWSRPSIPRFWRP